GKSHGFVLSGGVYTAIEYPGSRQTQVYGINDLTQVVGVAFDSTGAKTVPFLYDVPTHSFVRINPPWSKFVTRVTPQGINNAGTIVGTLTMIYGNIVGFEWIDGIYHWPLPRNYGSSAVTGINNAGVAIGSVPISDSMVKNFLFYPGKFESLEIPGSVTA